MRRMQYKNTILNISLWPDLDQYSCTVGIHRNNTKYIVFVYSSHNIWVCGMGVRYNNCLIPIVSLKCSFLYILATKFYILHVSFIFDEFIILYCECFIENHCSFVDSTYFPGQCADVIVQGTSVGRIGVLHPDVLQAFALNMPTSALEINLQIFV